MSLGATKRRAWRDRPGAIAGALGPPAWKSLQEGTEAAGPGSAARTQRADLRAGEGPSTGRLSPGEFWAVGEEDPGCRRSRLALAGLDHSEVLSGLGAEERGPLSGALWGSPFLFPTGGSSS